MRIKIIATSAVLGLGIAFIGPAAAAIAASDPPPGDGWIYAKPWTELPESVGPAILTGAGGWTVDGVPANGLMLNASSDTSRQFRVSISEPMRTDTVGPGSQRHTWVSLDYDGFPKLDEPSPYVPYIAWGAQRTVNNTVVNRVELVCSSTEWTKSTYPDSTGSQLQTTGLQATMSSFRQLAQTAITSDTDCPNIVSITAYLGVTTPDSAGEYEFHTFVWSADRQRLGTPYTGSGSTETLLDQLCTPLNAHLEECEGRVDPVDPEPGGACDNAPETSWAVWDWLGPFVVHFATCLFVPQNGFDSDSVLADAWENGTPGELIGLMENVARAFEIPETCGSITGEGDSGNDLLLLGSNWEIDTCQWNDWSFPVKTILSYIIIIGSAFFLLRFIVNIVVGIINKRTANPLGDDDE